MESYLTDTQSGMINESTKMPKRKEMIPKGVTNLLALSNLVLQAWTQETSYVLRWTTREEFANQVARLEEINNLNMSHKGNRSPISSRLRLLDKQINVNLRYVKNMIENIYGYKNRYSYYSKFGIEKTARGYSLPQDRQKRSEALLVLVKNIEQENIEIPNYGLQYWTDIYTEYQELISQTTTTVQDISKLVREKFLLLENIKKTLHSLVLLIRANYPDTWINQVRVWGFLKEFF